MDKYILLIEQINLLNVIAESLIDPLQLILHKDEEVFIVIKYLSAIEISCDVKCLLENRRTKSFPLIARSLLEEFINILWFIKDNHNLGSLIYESNLQELKIVKARIEYDKDDPEINKTEKYKKIKEKEKYYIHQLELLKERGCKKEHISKKCNDIGKDIEYKIEYSILCRNAHNDVDSMEERYIANNTKNNITLVYEEVKNIADYGMEMLIYFKCYIGIISCIVDLVESKYSHFNDELKAIGDKVLSIVLS